MPPDKPLYLNSGQVISLTVSLSTVSIEIHCSDDYEAQVLFEDLAERAQTDGVIIKLGGKREDP